MIKKRYWLAYALIPVILFGAGYVLLGSKALQYSDGLALQLRTDKESYLPGEVVSLHFNITNESGTPTLVSRQSTVWDGNLKVYVSTADGNFREYFGPGWGTRDTLPAEPIKLLPGQSFETEATLLWNQKLETSHLSEMYRKKLDKERLTTDYALPAVGQYYVKAILFFPQIGTRIESRPVLLSVQDPEGTDLEVWNVMKQNGAYGLFIQTGGLFEDPKGPKTTTIAGELQNLISRHPDSHYAVHIRQGLSKRQAAIDGMARDKEPEN